jgi:hypothetical protein
MATILYPISDNIYSEREMMFINYLRQTLSDTDDACQLFEDGQLYAYIDLALQDVNSHPMKTYYNLDTTPRDWMNVIILGAYVFAMNAQSLTEKARNFTISDQGVTYNPPDIPAHMTSLAQFQETKYQAEKERIKANEKPGVLGLGNSRVLCPNPSYLKMRHLRSHRFF